MLSDALKARIPIITVSTDDPIHVEEVLQSIAQAKLVKPLDPTVKVVLSTACYWTTDEKLLTVDMYHKFAHANTSLIVVNPSKSSNIAFDCGILPVPKELLMGVLDFVPKEKREKVAQVLKGMSLKSAAEALRLTITRTGGAKLSELRRTRLTMAGGIQGLIPMESESEKFYVWPSEVLDWLDTNQKYFESPVTPPKLVPRGLLLAGEAGTGKTMAARAVAHRLEIPMYRLDIAQMLDRYVGVSENRLVRSLALAEQEAPCVLLIDEVEKIFTHHEEGDTITRMLSSLLWWLSEHAGRVITIMTTNKIEKIPPELYRPGRLDRVCYLPELTFTEAKEFCAGVFTDVTGDPVTPEILQTLWAKLSEATISHNNYKCDDGLLWKNISHADVSELVYRCIKDYDWVNL
jgi:hypothetical protein